MGTNRNRKGRLFKINLRWWEPKEGKCDEQRLDAVVSRKRSGRVWWLEKNGLLLEEELWRRRGAGCWTRDDEGEANGRKQLQQ